MQQSKYIKRALEKNTVDLHFNRIPCQVPQFSSSHKETSRWPMPAFNTFLIRPH